MRFYVVVSEKQDGQWTKFKRSWLNVDSGTGFKTREAALEALNKYSSPGYKFQYRIVEILEQADVSYFEVVSRKEWR